MVGSLLANDAEAGFKALNKYLLEKVSDRDIESNMKAAAGWLEELKTTKHSLLSKSPIKDLELFTSLQQVREDTKCDVKAMLTMRDNLLKAGLNLVRRVDLVMKQIFIEHAKKCADQYPVIYKARKEQLDKVTYELVSTVAKRVIEADQIVAYRGEGVSKEEFYKLKNIINLYAIGRFSITSLDYGHFIRMALKENAKENPNVIYLDKVPNELTGKNVVHKDKIKELVKELVIEPCRRYVKDHGQQVFLPARWDGQYYIAEANEANAEFYFDWAFFSICRSAMEHESYVFSDVIDAVAHH